MEAFLRNAWYVAAWGTEISRQNLLRRTILNEPIVFYRKENGTPVALADKCAHRHAPLSKGKLFGDNVRCPYHGLEYDASGDCVHVPGQSNIPPDCKVRSYPAVERYQWIWIWTGDPELADPNEIEDFHWMDAAGWRAGGERMHLKANYKLLIENLMELSHLSYVHANTLGTGAVAEVQMTHERGERHVTLNRWVMDSPVSNMFQKLGGFEPGEHVDRWQHVTWTPPAFVKLDVGAARANTGAINGDRSQGFGYRNLNAITPETIDTAHYFWAQARDFRIDEDWISDMFVASTHEAFSEDLWIIGHQQTNMGTGTTEERVDINHDGAALQAIRILRGMIEEERTGEAPQAAE